MNAVTGHVTATPDPPPTGIRNPIHDADGADGAGYAGALVAGVRTYGWAAQTIVRALGPTWLESGWADVTLRRPLFAGERVTITVTPPESSAAGGTPPAGWGLTCLAGADEQAGEGQRIVLDGTVGIGDAPWLDELDPPAPEAAEDPPEVRPTYDLESIPLGEPLRPLAAYVKADAARRLATDDLGLTDPDDLEPYVAGDRPRLHPYFLAGRMAPLTRHNFTYGPTIHVRTQIQHRGDALADQPITVGAKIVDAYDRNGHWYQVLDGIVTAGDGETLALIRHHTIFRPRGTTLPEPLRSSFGGRRSS
jgi:hypothetical protein